MAKPKKKSTKNKSKNMKKADVAVSSNDAIQQEANSVEIKNNISKKFDKKFTIIEEEVKKNKDIFVKNNHYLKGDYIYALISKDVEALQLLSAIKPINELLSIEEIFERILHIRVSEKPEDNPIKEFLKQIKNVPYEGQVLSENDLVTIREEITRNIPANQRVKKIQAIKVFNEKYPSLFSQEIDYFRSLIKIKDLQDCNDNNSYLGKTALIKALNSEGEIAAYYYDQAIEYFSTHCQKLATNNLDIINKKLLDCSIESLIYVSKLFRTETSSVTDLLLIDLCNKHQTHTKKEMFEFLAIAADSSYISGYIEDAAIIAESAYQIYANYIQDFLYDKKLLFNSLMNLGNIIFSTDVVKGKACMEQAAYEGGLDSKEGKAIMIKLGLIKRDYTDSDIYDLSNFIVLLKSNINQLDVSDAIKIFKSIPRENSTNYKVVQIVLDVLQDFHAQAHAKLYELLESTNYIQEKIDKLTSILGFITTIKNLDWKLYYEHLNNSHKNVFNNSKDMSLIYYKFILQINNDLIDEAFFSLKNISNKKHYLDRKFVSYFASQAEEIYISTLIEKKEIFKAKEYLNNELYTKKLKSKFLSLLNTLEQAEQLQNTESEQESRDIEEITSIIDLADITKAELDGSDEEEVAITDSEIPLSEDEDIFTNLTPQEIHKYFQHLKAQAIKSNPANKLSKSSEHSWYLENTCIDSKSSEVIKVPNKDNFYALIDPKLLATLDSATANQFHTALEKGFALRKIGQNGIKLLGNNLMELKINAEHRLCTDKMYKNPNGDVLMIFSEKYTHKEVAKIAKDSYIKTIDVESSAPFDFLQNHAEFKQESAEMLFENPSCDEDSVEFIGDADNGSL